jgi:hypothetical protein
VSICCEKSGTMIAKTGFGAQPKLIPDFKTDAEGFGIGI